MYRLFLYIVAFWLLAFSFLPDDYLIDNIKASLGSTPEPIYPHDDYDDDERLTFKDQKWQRHPSPNFIVYTHPEGKYPTEADTVSFPFTPADNHALAYIPTSVKWKMPEKIESLSYIRYATEDELGRRSRVHTDIAYDNDSLRLPIASITVDPEDLFGEFNGIYVQGAKAWEKRKKWSHAWWNWPANYHQRGIKYERKASFLLLNKKGEQLTEQLAGIRINGNATRAYPQKSLRINFRKSYGKKKIKTEDWGRHWPEKSTSLVLRNGGNDWDFTLTRDALCHQMALKMNLIAQDYSPVRLYINGLYWGIHNLRPRMDKNFYAEKLNIKKSKVIVLEGEEVKYKGDYEAHELDDILTKEQCWEHLEKEKIFAYFALEIFAANTDWPVNNTLWVKNKNGKWEPAVKDMDCSLGFGGTENVKLNLFEKLNNSKGYNALVYKRIMNDEKVKSEFINYFKNALETNLAFESWSEELAKIQDLLSHEIPHHASRWRKFDEKQWHENMTHLKTFVQKRHKEIQRQLRVL